MTHKRILPYKMGSRSSKALRDALNVLQVHPDPSRSKYRAEREWYSRRQRRTLRRRPTTIINWGCSQVPEHLASNVQWINHPDKVALSVDKRLTLKALSEAGIACPEHTTNIHEAQTWLDEGHVVFARTLVNAHSARGLIVCEHGPLPQAPLYTKYIKKSKEYRVHCLVDGSVHVIEKRRNMSVPDEQVNWQVRNHSNGFIFAAELSFLPSDLKDLCSRAKQTLNLDFCAFDAVYNGHQDKSYIIECNTALGLEGRTLDMYANSFRRIL